MNSSVFPSSRPYVSDSAPNLRARQAELGMAGRDLGHRHTTHSPRLRDETRSSLCYVTTRVVGTVDNTYVLSPSSERRLWLSAKQLAAREARRERRARLAAHREQMAARRAERIARAIERRARLAVAKARASVLRAIRHTLAVCRRPLPKHPLPIAHVTLTRVNGRLIVTSRRL